MATCSASTLLSNGKDFQRLSKRELQIVIAQLLCNISGGSGGGGGSTIGIVYTGSVVPEGVVTAPVGSIYNQIVGGTLVGTFTKVSGSGNTGWQ